MLKMYNTLEKTLSEVQPIEDGVVKMYTCGPTVYRDAHIGNLRSYLMADWIRRILTAQGLDVVHIKNITDVGHMRQEMLERGEDKIIAAAIEEGKTPAEMAPAVAETLIGPSSSRESFDRLVDSMAALHVESYIKAIEASGLQPQTLDISTIAVPTLIVCGEYDRLTPPEVSREMHRAIPGSELCIIEDAGHLSNIENPRRFNEVVMEFLERQVDG